MDLLWKIRRHIPRGGALMRLWEPLSRMDKLGRVELRSTLRFVRHHGLAVTAGPYAGMRYPRSSVSSVRDLVTRLTGTHELELHPAIESAIAARPELVVNIGAQDGYYAVGMARRCPAARVIAFEVDPYHARTCSRLVRLNGVADRVEVRGLCTSAQLARLEVRGRAVVICDCDGGELELLDRSRVDWLRHATLVVETHDRIVPGTSDGLRASLEPTHEIELVQPRPRYIGDHELLGITPGLKPREQQLLIMGRRIWPTPWLIVTPRD